MSDFPEIGGKPAAKIHTHFTEKIGLPKYSSVDYGTSVTRFVEDTPENIASERDAMTESCNEWMGARRESIAEWLKQQPA